MINFKPAPDYLMLPAFSSRMNSIPLTAWQGEIIEYFNVAGWWFPTGYNCTGLQHAKAIPDEVISFLISKTSKKEMNHGSRSPPDGLVSF